MYVRRREIDLSLLVKLIGLPYLLKGDMVLLPIDDLPSCDKSNAAAEDVQLEAVFDFAPAGFVL